MNKTKKLTMVSMLFALALVLSIIENSLPQIQGIIPGIKLGLSNIVVMYTLFFLGVKYSFGIAVLKAGFTFIIRGIIAFSLSLCGGIASIIVMMLLIAVFKQKLSYIFISICGSLAHNMVQLVLAVLITGSKFTFAYLPILVISGVIMGLITGTILNAVMPYFDKLYQNK